MFPKNIFYKMVFLVLIIRSCTAMESRCNKDFDINANIKVIYFPGDMPVRLVKFDLLDRLKSFYADGIVELWNVETGNCEDILLDQDNCATAVAFSPDGMFTASGHVNGTIELCNVKTKSCVNTFWRHKDFVSAVAFSFDGRFIASGSWDKTVKLWDLEKKIFKHTFVGHKGRINDVAFSPNGRLIASGSEDGTIRLWNIETKKCLCRFTHWPVPVTSVAFNKNGTQIAVGLEDGIIVVYKDIFAQKKIFALAQAMHPRLGDESSAQSLNSDILRLIYEKLKLDVRPWEAVFGK